MTETAPTSDETTNSTSGSLTRAPAQDDTRRNFRLSEEQARELLVIATPAQGDVEAAMADPAYRNRLNGWWFNNGVAMGFRWTTVGDLLWVDGIDGQARPDFPHDPARITGVTFTAVPEVDAFAPAMLSKATGLLIDAMGALKMFIEDSDEHRLGERIERFFAGPWQQMDGLREAREDSATAFGAGFAAARSQAVAAMELVGQMDVANVIGAMEPSEDLDEQFNPYRQMVERNRYLEQVEVAWKEMSRPLSWMQGPGGRMLPIQALGRNLAEIANDLIAARYPLLTGYIQTPKLLPTWPVPELARALVEEMEAQGGAQAFDFDHDAEGESTYTRLRGALAIPEVPAAPPTAEEEDRADG